MLHEGKRPAEERRAKNLESLRKIVYLPKVGNLASFAAMDGEEWHRTKVNDDDDEDHDNDDDRLH